MSTIRFWKHFKHFSRKHFKNLGIIKPAIIENNYMNKIKTKNYIQLKNYFIVRFIYILKREWK